MTSLEHIFYDESLREYQNEIASLDPKYNKKLKEKELDDKYKDKMMEGCRVFAKELENINKKKFTLGSSSSLIYTFIGAENYEYIYTECPELKKFIAQFNSKNKSNQIKINDKFVNKISVNVEDVKNGQLNYELSYELKYKDGYKTGYSYSGYHTDPQPPSKDNVFFG